MIELKAKKVMIFGTGGSGKTVYTKSIWNTFKNPMAYDINNDFEKMKGGISYIPVNIQDELLSFVKFFVEFNQKKGNKKIDALFFDDSDVYFNEHSSNIPLIRDLIIRHRNLYDVALIFISKRPQNLPTIITNNANVLITFRMEGHNAINRLKDIDVGIYDLLPKLNENPYSYITKFEGDSAVFNKAITIK